MFKKKQSEHAQRTDGIFGASSPCPFTSIKLGFYRVDNLKII